MNRIALLAFRLGLTALLLAAAWLQIYGFAPVPAALHHASPARRGVVVAWVVLSGGGALASVTLGLALLWRVAPRPDARALAAFAGMAAWFFAWGGIARLNGGNQPGSLLHGVVEQSVPVAVLFGLAALLRFSVLFPRPLTPADLPGRARRLLLDGRVAWGGAVGWVALVAALAWVDTLVMARHPRAAPLLWMVVPATIALMLATLAVAVANLRLGYALADAEGRRRIFWIVEGFLAGTGIVVVASAVKLATMVGGSGAGAGWYPLAGFAALFVMVVCLGIAMFGAGAIDPALVVRRTALVGAVGVAMIFLFAGVEQAVQQYVGEWLGWSDRLGGIVTGGIVALSVDPVKRQVEALAARILARDRTVEEAAPGAVAARG
jgi:hypothetical protein